jgi:hypothetical protein
MNEKSGKAGAENTTPKNGGDNGYFSNEFFNRIGRKLPFTRMDFVQFE